MQVKVQFFASLKEALKISEMTMSLEDEEGTCGQVVNRLEERINMPIMNRCFFAKNGSYATMETVLHDGDELAILPPVSGG